MKQEHGNPQQFHGLEKPCDLIALHYFLNCMGFPHAYRYLFFLCQSMEIKVLFPMYVCMYVCTVLCKSNESEF